MFKEPMVVVIFIAFLCVGVLSVLIFNAQVEAATRCAKTGGAYQVETKICWKADGTQLMNY